MAAERPSGDTGGLTDGRAGGLASEASEMVPQPGSRQVFWRRLCWLPRQLLHCLASCFAIIISAVTKRLRGPGGSSCESTEEEGELRIVLVGKTGAGKSATGNTILGEEQFDSRFEFTPVTQTCQRGVREWKRKRIVVIDTPATFSSAVAGHTPEIDKCCHLCLPGPHALLLVTQMGRFTEEDFQSAERVKKIFGREACEYMIVVFTRREDLCSETLEEYVEGTDNNYLRQVIHACSHRYCGFNNSERGEAQRKQAEDLLSQVEEMVRKSQGRPYCAV